MNNNVLKFVAGLVAFFLAYIGISYLIDHKIDWVMSLCMVFGYCVVEIICLVISSKKKDK